MTASKSEEMITITKARYDEMRKDELKLIALDNAGVDNWEWYSTAMDEYRDMLIKEVGKLFPSLKKVKPYDPT